MARHSFFGINGGLIVVTENRETIVDNGVAVDATPLFNAAQPYVIGGMYLIRTVTYFLSGKIESVGPNEICLSTAAWIADTGRFSNSIATGDFDEVEPYPSGLIVIVGRNTVIDAVQIPKLPTSQK